MFPFVPSLLCVFISSLSFFLSGLTLFFSLFSLPLPSLRQYGTHGQRMSHYNGKNNFNKYLFFWETQVHGRKGIAFSFLGSFAMSTYIVEVYLEDRQAIPEESSSSYSFHLFRRPPPPPLIHPFPSTKRGRAHCSIWDNCREASLF